jgi:hypothetical protein
LDVQVVCVPFEQQDGPVQSGHVHGVEVMSATFSKALFGLVFERLAGWRGWMTAHTFFRSLHPPPALSIRLNCHPTQPFTCFLGGNFPKVSRNVEEHQSSMRLSLKNPGGHNACRDHDFGIKLSASLVCHS